MSFLNFILVMQEAIHKDSIRWSYIAVVGVDAAFCISAMITGFALMLHRRWSQVAAAAVWSAVFVDSVYWSWSIGGFLLEHRQYFDHYVDGVPRFLFHLVAIPACPYAVCGVFMNPEEDPVSRRLLTGALVGGLLVCGIVPGVIVSRY